jgi:carboxyl-terminal processing protease
VSLTRLFRLALSHAAAALLAAGLVASCETTPGSAPPPTRSAATAADVSVERVILQAYRAIGDRHLNEPDFRKMSLATYRGFASSDSALALQSDGRTYTVTRDGREVLSREAPGDPTDGRAWGGMLAELFAASIDASPVLQQTDRGVLIKGAMVATTKQLDRNSRYADPDEAKDNRFQRDGGGGIGITVERTDDKKVLIRAIQEASPSAKAGVQVGDQILAIDGEMMADASLNDIVHKLRGSVGQPVTLTVLRPSQGSELVIGMKRGRIIPTTVLYERHGNVALIHLSGFNSATTETLHRAIDRARAEIGRELGGIILDMRSNRGGLLDQAQSVAEEFIGDGVIFSTQGRHPDSQRIYRSGSRHSAELPMVVLVNGNSASAAEIVAAALQDRGRAVIVGTTSYGKGTVQTVIRMPNEGELVLTWSRLLAPSGYTWNELGVMPNVCSAKVEPGTLGTETVDGSRALLQRWHAERHPSQQEVASMRKICPPGEETPNRDLDIASHLLRDPALYAHAVRTGAGEQAAASRP